MRFYKFLTEANFKSLKWDINAVRKLVDPNVPLEKISKQEKKYISQLEDAILSNKTSPIEITVKNNKPYKIWDGMHRLIAYLNLGFKEVPVKFVDENGKPINKIYYEDDIQCDFIIF